MTVVVGGLPGVVLDVRIIGDLSWDVLMRRRLGLVVLVLSLVLAAGVAQLMPLLRFKLRGCR